MFQIGQQPYAKFLFGAPWCNAHFIINFSRCVLSVLVTQLIILIVASKSGNNMLMYIDPVEYFRQALLLVLTSMYFQSNSIIKNN